MNKVLFGIAGFMMAAALVIGGPGVAKATPIAAAAINLGSDTTSIVGSMITASEINSAPWLLTGYSTGTTAIGTVAITGGSIVLNTSTNTVGFTGTIEGNTFNVTGALSDYSKAALPGGVQYYSWLIQFPELSTLSNSTFRLTGAYSGTLSIDQNTSGPTAGLGAVNLNVSQSAVPVPPSVLLLFPGLLGLVGIRKRLKG